ncbi:histidine phosphatase family protein [Bacillus sp. RAR_GA_16]|uniref:histidine phosphatase family protein n=1 Tax=Bacillus sp. RAR_GA_16 TaxID=2876774 RepID=UPI001CCC4DED|nr:histidine phosphatase family protein [Bacillus sp. RAR_GA_16]MCA0173396.1 histidine phosphatase family protein [Bacillus sp. RAR_GA_16]
MNKKIYLVRHCQATGQEPAASLTREGRNQSIQLAQTLKSIPFDQLYSSPYRRAVQSIEPLALQLDKSITLDERLEERKLSGKMIENWLEELEKTFNDHSYSISGGESSQEAAYRGIASINDALHNTKEHGLLMTHGNLLTLILHHFDSSFDFNTWKALRNPEIYCLTFQRDEIESIENVALIKDSLL